MARARKPEANYMKCVQCKSAEGEYFDDSVMCDGCFGRLHFKCISKLPKAKIIELKQKSDFIKVFCNECILDILKNLDLLPSVKFNSELKKLPIIKIQKPKKGAPDSETPPTTSEETPGTQPNVSQVSLEPQPSTSQESSANLLSTPEHSSETQPSVSREIIEIIPGASQKIKKSTEEYSESIQDPAEESTKSDVRTSKKAAEPDAYRLKAVPTSHTGVAKQAADVDAPKEFIKSDADTKTETTKPDAHIPEESAKSKTQVVEDAEKSVARIAEQISDTPEQTAKDSAQTSQQTAQGLEKSAKSDAHIPETISESDVATLQEITKPDVQTTKETLESDKQALEKIAKSDSQILEETVKSGAQLLEKIAECNVQTPKDAAEFDAQTPEETSKPSDSTFEEGAVEETEEKPESPDFYYQPLDEFDIASFCAEQFNHFEAGFRFDPSIVFNVLYDEIRQLVAKKEYSAAVSCAETTILKFRQIAREALIDLAVMLNLMADVYKKQGHKDTATDSKIINLMGEAFLALESTFGARHISVAVLAGNVAYEYNTKKNYVNAENYYKKALESLTLLGGFKTVIQIKKLTEYALMKKNQGDLVEAGRLLKILLQVYKANEEQITPNDWKYGKIQMHLTAVYCSMGEHEKELSVLKSFLSDLHNKAFGTIDETHKALWQLAEEWEDTDPKPINKSTPADTLWKTAKLTALDLDLARIAMEKMANCYGKLGKFEARKVVFNCAIQIRVRLATSSSTKQHKGG